MNMLDPSTAFDEFEFVGMSLDQFTPTPVSSTASGYHTDCSYLGNSDITEFQPFESHHHPMPLTHVPYQTQASYHHNAPVSFCGPQLVLEQQHDESFPVNGDVFGIPRVEGDNFEMPIDSLVKQEHSSPFADSFDDLDASETYSYATSPSSPTSVEAPVYGTFPVEDFEPLAKKNKRKAPVAMNCTKKKVKKEKKEDIHKKATPNAVENEQDREQQIQQFVEKVKRSNMSKGRKSKRDQFACTYPGCDRKFVWAWARDEHAATHLPDVGRVHQCTYCDKSFFTNGCLKSHLKIHTRKPYSYECKYPGCTKKYCTSEGLRLHNRNVHEGDKKWRCPTDGCGKSFVRQSDLRLHIIRIHFTERPYPCTVESCKKSFACYSELKRHLTSHSGANQKK